MGGETRPGQYWGALRGAVTPEARPTANESGMRRVTPRPCRVLLVEDEDMVRKVLLRMLTSRGYDVKTATNVSEAEALFQVPGNDFELLITDVMIPQGSGHALARSLVERQPELRVLFVSGYSGGNPIEGIDPAQVRFLTKPFGSAELSQMIAELLPADP
jgi:two-component system, cell cycle sensor histidine kinase and response regulator CckA